MVFAGFRRATGVDSPDLPTAELKSRERFSFGSGVVEAVGDFSMPRRIGVLVLGGLRGAIGKFRWDWKIDRKRRTYGSTKEKMQCESSDENGAKIGAVW
jgi:hypothetical protein